MVARHDLVTDAGVVGDLATVRLGTSVLRRAISEVDDAALDEPSLLPDWDRRHLVAHLGYNARAIARLVTWAATGEEHPMYASPEARAEEIELGASQNPEALRHLAEHAAIDLDVRWRDLPADRWARVVRTAQGREVPVAETVWMRSREVWLHAVDLGTGVRLVDLPAAVLNRLLGDVQRTWASRGEAIDVDAEVAGSLPDVVGWATGRSDGAALEWKTGSPRPAPRWL